MKKLKNELLQILETNKLAFWGVILATAAYATILLFTGWVFVYLMPSLFGLYMPKTLFYVVMSVLFIISAYMAIRSLKIHCEDLAQEKISLAKYKKSR